MVRRILCLIVCSVFSVCGLAQRVKTVSGEYTYVVPENMGLEQAKQIALERVQTQLIADEFGTVVSQTNSTQVKNSNGKSSVDFLSVGGSEVRGEWIETIGNPKYTTSVSDGHIVIYVSVKGRIRETISSMVDFKALVLRNGTDDRYEDDTFRNGDDLFLSFQSPVDGYVAVYLVDNDGAAFCLLPYQNQTDGNVRVKANERYVFFSEKQASPDLRMYVDEYTMTCSHSQELNQIYVVFSTNPFVKAVDGKSSDALPRMLTEGEFQKWLAKCRVKDRQMGCKRISISVNK